jgi:glucosamine 6-phosphate synthetase-like amidotransferase/phosphosugar isomerase protein
MVPTRTAHPFWMFDELMASPAALDAILSASEAEQARRAEIASRLAAARTVYLTGCGTAFHAALVGAVLLREATGGRMDARAAQAFELTHYTQPAPGSQDALVVLSHSGQPSATNAALARARAAGAYTLTITGAEESPAARAAEVVLPTGYAETQSFAYTISYSLMLAMLVELASWAGIAASGERPFGGAAREIPAWHRAALAQSEPIRTLAERWRARERWIFAGAGANWATALEAGLKMQETNYTASQGMQMEEVLHGPVAALGDAVLVVIAPPGAGRERAFDLLRAARLLGGESLALGEPDDTALAEAATAFVPMPVCPEALSPAPYHVPVHLLSYWLAVAKGTNPDLMRREDPRYLAARQSYTL